MSCHSIKETADHFRYHENHLRKLIRQKKVKPPRRLYPGGKPFYTDADWAEMSEATGRISQREVA